MQIITKSEKETFEFAKQYARKLKGGEIIGLVGDLGAGKTVFAKGLAAGLGIKDTITSPTFVIMKIYQGRNSEFGIRNLVHIDAYRVKSPKDIIAIGAEEYFNRADTVTLIEWADKIKKVLTNSNKYTIINFIISENNKRRIICRNTKNMQEGQIRSINNKLKNTIERTMIDRENLTFKERKEKAMEKVDIILENANMAKIADSLLEQYSFSEIDGMPEEKLLKYCDPYDAAVIVSLTKKIESNKKNAN